MMIHIFIPHFLFNPPELCCRKVEIDEQTAIHEARFLFVIFDLISRCCESNAFIGQLVVSIRGRVPRDAGEHIGQPGLRIDVVKLGGDDEAVQQCGPLATAIGTGEQPGLAAEGQPAQRPIGGVVAEADPAIVEEAAEGGPALEHVVHGGCEVGVAR